EGHEQGGRDSLSRDIGDDQSPLFIIESDEVVEVAAHLRSREIEAFKFHARKSWRCLREETLLDHFCDLEFLLDTFLLCRGLLQVLDMILQVSCHVVERSGE